MKYDVLTVGAVIRDVFLESELFRVLKDPVHLKRIGFATGEAQCFALGAKVEIDRPVLTVGGGAANSAVTFARQGLRAGMLAKVGRDEFGRGAVATLKREGIDVLVREDKSEGTAYSTVLLSPGGERTILTYRGASGNLNNSDIPPRINARWMHISPGSIPFPVVRSLIEKGKREGTRIVMNPSKIYLKQKKNLSPLLKKLDVVVLNREEAAYLTGYKYDDEKMIFKKLDRIVKGIAVMTDGPRGVVVSDGARMYRAKTFKEKNITDRTGAGDAFGSGFVAALVDAKEKNGYFLEKDIMRAIRLGSANATSVVEYVGAQKGILIKREFERNSRWRRLHVAVTSAHV